MGINFQPKIEGKSKISQSQKALEIGSVSERRGKEEKVGN